MLVWGTTYAAIRVGLETVPPFTGVALRFAIATVVVLLVARLVSPDWRQGGNRWGLWTFNAICHFVIPYGVTYWAEQWLPSGLAAVIFSSYPLFVAVLAHLMLRGERLSWLSSVGVLLGFAGVALIYSDDLGALADPQARLAAGVILLSPLASAVGDVAIKKYWTHVHAVSLTAPSLGITAVIMGAMALTLEDWRPSATPLEGWLIILYLALFGTALTFTIYFRLLARVRVTGLSLITYGIPIIALAVGTFWLGEVITPRVIAGAFLVLVGVAAALRRKPPRKPPGGVGTALTRSHES